jgi:aminodeoxyfutalosine deaminase
VSNNVRVLAAEWVLPVSSEPVRDGVVAVDGRRVTWVGARRDLPSRYLRAPFRAFPRSLLLPGWVNAHCHLNLTAALGLIPGTADRFADWIRRLLQVTALWTEPIARQSVTAGMDLLASTGTTTVAHVTTLPGLEPILAHPMRAVVFHEPIAFPAARAPDQLRLAEEWLDAAAALIADAGTERVTLGLAPHAPYSVSPELFRGAARLARERGLPLSVHVAETRAEEEFVRTGVGQLREFLEERGTWDPAWKPPGVSPVRYLADLGLLAQPGLAVHANYLSDEDARLLARGRLAPVWCPGSHRFFGHRDHPAPRLLDAGAPLALGTDSLASNRGLNMLREARLAAESFPQLPREVWLQSGTLAAAAALGLGETTGSLEPEKAADLQVLDGVPEETTDPLAALFEAALRVRLVLVDGEEITIR